MERRSSNRYQNLNERDLQRKLLLQSKWSRREEADFYRVASTFGVERDLSTGQYKWATFRSLAKLDKKFDETLTEYFLAFYHMCTTVCKKFKSREEGTLCVFCGEFASPPDWQDFLRQSSADTIALEEVATFFHGSHFQRSFCSCGH